MADKIMQMWRIYSKSILLLTLSFCVSACQSDRAERDEKTLVLQNTAQTQPGKAVSTSLCGDSYLQTFAPDHIAALSWQSRSPLSRANQAQKALPQIRDNIEVILPHTGHLILFGPGEGMTLNTKLPQSLSLKWIEDFEGVYDNARAVLAALKLPQDSAETWYHEVRKLKEGQKTRRSSDAESTPKILYFTPAGGSAGPNTFLDAVITLAGGVNANQTPGWHSPDLETLLSYEPDLILRSFSGSHYHSRSNVRTPVLDAHFSSVPVIDIAGKYWPCAGPGLLDATFILKQTIDIYWDKSDA